MVPVQQVMVAVSCSHCKGGQILSNLHLLLKLRSLQLLAKKLIFSCLRQCGGVILAGNHGQVLHKSVSDGEIVFLQAAKLCQQHLYKSDSVVQLQFLGLYVILSQLNLKQVVPKHDSCIDGCRNILVDVIEQLLYCIDGLNLFFKGNQLPEVFLNPVDSLVLCQLKLQLAGFFAHFRKLVAVDNLSAGKDWLNSHHASQEAVFHHFDANWIAQGGNGFGRQNLCQYLCYTGGKILAGVNLYLGHSVVGGEPHSGGADVGEEFGEGFLALLRSSLGIIAGRLQG